jgi:MoxR-like ATPase
MNINEAKEEVKKAVRAYLERDEAGQYEIPVERQRPILLMGPPGIGKTAIMEQIAHELGINLVSYTITHHTRQSAIGLPMISEKTYGERNYSVTEYTMSEIIGSIYDQIERSGIKEGILFLDEINCVSETLAPMMLQFLQCKTFGNRKLPEGWIIIAAGNPPEYNRSVRDFDVVTLDRVKRIDIEADFSVWKEYAQRKGLHGAVVSYLDINKDNFFRMENTVDGPQFATARGWEDLSELLTAYEKLGIRAGREVIGEYIQLPAISRDFANYLELYYKYQRVYHVDDILKGSYEKITLSQMKAAPFDERIAVMNLMLSRLKDSSGKAFAADRLTEALYDSLKKTFSAADKGEHAEKVLEELAREKRAELKKTSDAGNSDLKERNGMLRLIAALEDFALYLKTEGIPDSESTYALKERFRSFPEMREEAVNTASEELNNAYSFLEEAFGDSQEMVMFTTMLTSNADTSLFIENFGCEPYYRHNKELLFDDTRSRITKEILDAKKAPAEDTADADVLKEIIEKF